LLFLNGTISRCRWGFPVRDHERHN